MNPTRRCLALASIFVIACGGGGDEPEGPLTVTDPTGDHYRPYESNQPASDGAAAFDLIGATVHLADGVIHADLELAAPVVSENGDIAAYDLVITGPGGTASDDAFNGGIYDLAWETEIGGSFECHLLMWNGGGFQLVEQLPAGASCTVNGTHLVFALPAAVTGQAEADLGISILTQEYRGFDYYVDRLGDAAIAPIPGA